VLKNQIILSKNNIECKNGDKSAEFKGFEAI
jgi:hypothetical protein